MSGDDLEHVETRLRAFFEAREDLAAVYLFGSVARGEARPKSDVDIALLFAHDPPRTLESLPVDVEDELTRLLGRPVQVVVLNHTSADLVHRVLCDGKLVSEHDPAARVRFEVRRRNEYFDLLPILRRYRRAHRSPTQP